MRQHKSTLTCRRCRQSLPHDAFELIERTERPGTLRRDKWCHECRKRWREWQKGRPPIPNPDDSTGVTMLVPLTHGKFAVINAADAELVAAYRWHASKVRDSDRWYALTTVHIDGNKTVVLRMHRLVAGTSSPEVDHWNGDGLDNRRQNLRGATRRQNKANGLLNRNNTSGFKGVTRTREGRWAARVGVNGVRRYLGTFATAKEAARAYDAHARQAFGPFARTNFTD